MGDCIGRIVIMAIKNDEKILELKKQIDVKKKDLAKKKVKFTPETNCILELDNIKYNLNVATEDTLSVLMLRLNLYVISAKDLNVPLPIISGYSVDIWITDIKNKLSVSGTKREEIELKNLETKLNKMLSDDKKTELELEEIATLLK